MTKQVIVHEKADLAITEISNRLSKQGLKISRPAIITMAIYELLETIHQNRPPAILHKSLSDDV